MPSRKALEKAAQKEKEKEIMEKKRLEDESWEIGTNKRAAKREMEQNKRQEEKMKQASEMKQLIAEDDTSLPSGGKRNKGKKSKTDSLALLQQALKEAPKTKAQREKEEKEKEKEQRMAEQQRQEMDKKEKQKIQEEYYKTLKNKNMVQDDTIFNSSDNQSNEIHIHGIESAIAELDNTSMESKNVKVLYNAFREEQLGILKQQQPGLRLSQYEDRIQKMWKTSPQNPHLNK